MNGAAAPGAESPAGSRPGRQQPSRAGSEPSRAAAEAIAELEDRLARHPPDRYPVQHATVQFHLGVVFTDAGRAADAQRALAVAVRLFDPGRLPVENAKATNALGAALRLAGSLDGAAEAFRRAAGAFDAADLPLEQGAALFNLGLVERESGDADAAAACFAKARDRLDPKKVPAESAAASRELGSALLAAGKLAAACDALTTSLDLARRSGDQTGLGASANVLGLAQLAQGHPLEAAEAFRAAVAAHPRSVRPEGYAMAKANLALAFERAGDAARARLAAAQALGVPGAAEPVQAQAGEILRRLGASPGALMAVLEDEPPDRWPVVVREEVARWVDAEAATRRAELAAWIEGLLRWRAQAAELAEAWLGALLELPPDAMTATLRSALEALAEMDTGAAERFRSDVSRAMVRFHVPQWMRLRDTFNRVAGELGQEQEWS